jgi:hypothetical protein
MSLIPPPPGPGPTFLCIGTQRAGTTWLHRALARAPGWWMPPFKELNFFAEGGPDSNLVDKLMYMHGVLGDQLRNGPIDKAELRWFAALTTAPAPDLGWYRMLFSPAGPRFSGDLSPAYGLLDEAGVRRVHAGLPDVKIVVLLRHPVERADSQAGLMQAWERWPRDLPEEQLIERLTGPFSGYGEAAAVVARWEAVFGPRQVGVFFYDHLKRDPVGTFARITAFLGRPVDPRAVPLDLGERVNTWARPARSEAFYRALAQHFLPKVAPLRRRFPDPVDGWCRELEAAARR